MVMAANGLVKLNEECGELIQISSKKQAFPRTDIHPDGKGSMKQRLEEEIADVEAACEFVKETHGLSRDAINVRKACNEVL